MTDDVSEKPQINTWLERGIVWKFCQALCRIVTTVLFDLKVYGAEHVPETGGVLLVANHESYLDPVLVGVQLRRPLSFMAKSELFKNPLFAWLIRSLHAFPVRQGAGDRGAMMEAIRRLQEGHVLNIFPEGSRTATGELGPIQRGAALMVSRANVPIVPVVITGSYEAWPKGQLLPKPHPIRVMYGPALDLEGKKGDDISRLIDQTFRKMLADLRSRG